MGKASSPPQAPNPNKVAQQQTASNVATAEAQAALNNMNTVGPGGSVGYSISGYTPVVENGKTVMVPNYTQTTSLSPGSQSIYNTQQAIAGGLANLGLNIVGYSPSATSSAAPSGSAAPAAAPSSAPMPTGGAGSVAAPAGPPTGAPPTGYYSGPGSSTAQIAYTAGVPQGAVFRNGGGVYAADGKTLLGTMNGGAFHPAAGFTPSYATSGGSTTGGGGTTGSTSGGGTTTGTTTGGATSGTGAPLTAAGLPVGGQIPTGPLSFADSQALGTPGQINQDQIDAVYGQATARLDPQWADNERQLTDRLALQGIPVGSEAYDKAMRDFNFAKTDAYQTAKNAAIQQGAAIGAQTFGEQMSARQQGNSEAQTLYQEPMNELAAILQGSPAFATPSPANIPGVSVAPTDVTGAYGLAQQGALANYQAQIAQQNALYGGLGGLAGTLGGAALMMGSSITIKENFQAVNDDEILAKLTRLPLSTWNYIGDPTRHIGPMAEHFRDLFGVGDGKTIAVVDAIGVLTAAARAIARRA